MTNHESYILGLLLLLLRARRTKNAVCVDVAPVSLIPFCDGTSISTDPAPRWSQFPATQTVDLGCNPVENVQSVAFCDGTTMGPGNSFDIKAAAPLVLEGTPDGDYQNAAIVWNGRTVQDNSTFALAKNVVPMPDPEVFGRAALLQWTPRHQNQNQTPTVVAQTPTGIVWSPQRREFVGVSNLQPGNLSVRSTDGIVWTETATLQQQQWRAIAWSPKLSLYAAVSDGPVGATQRCMTSPDGLTWTLRTTPGAASPEWIDIVWSSELELFVAVARVGTVQVMTSVNGIDWVAQTAATANRWESICWSPQLSLFVSVSSTGTNDRVMTSSDGVVWTSRQSPNNNSWWDVCWSSQQNLFVAVSTDGTDRVMTSPNGIEWTARASADETRAWWRVEWIQELGLFVSCSALPAGVQLVQYSTDGKVWQSLPIGAQNSSNVTLAWSPFLGILVLGSLTAGARILTSSLAGRPPTAQTALSRISELGMWTFESFGRGVPVTVTANATVSRGQNWIICNSASTITLTLPAPASFPGMELTVKTLNGAVNSSLTNIVPFAGGVATSTILGAGAGNWVTLVASGSQWLSFMN